jgi:DNA-binding MarR family transcriptional regulator
MKLESSKNLIALAPRLMDVLKIHIREGSAGRLTHPQYRIMANISRGIKTVTEIAARHGVSQPTMTKAINLMVEKGWIAKSTDKKDARQTQLSLTAKGSALFLDVRGIAQKSLGDQIQHLQAGDRKKLDRAVADLQSILMKWNSLPGVSK